jgi:hypothetical protein
MSGAALDAQRYLNHYPGEIDNPDANKNLLFFQNKLRSRPDNMLLTEFHELWWNNFDALESHHGYIQWLFPIREQVLFC